MLFRRKCKVTFISHGATINTEENRLFDDESYPSLNAAGKFEIERISMWIKNKGLKIDKILTSPALRTIQSARILSSVINHDFEVIDELKSRKSGIWSGLSYEEIEQKYPKQLDDYHLNPDVFSPEGGESVFDFNNKVNSVISGIIKNNLHKRLIIVTHREVIQAAVANALSIPIKSQFKVYIPTGSATQISYFEDFSSLVYSAYIPL